MTIYASYLLYIYTVDKPVTGIYPEVISLMETLCLEHNKQRRKVKIAIMVVSMNARYITASFVIFNDVHSLQDTCPEENSLPSI